MFKKIAEQYDIDFTPYVELICIYDFSVPSDMHEYLHRRLRENAETNSTWADFCEEVDCIAEEIESKGADIVEQFANNIKMTLAATMLLSNQAVLNNPVMASVSWMLEQSRIRNRDMGIKIIELEDKIKKLEAGYVL